MGEGPESDEQAFRALLDDEGILRPDALVVLPSPTRAAAFTVFAQRADARLDVAELQRHGARFFATKLGLTVDKRYPEGAAGPHVDAARIVVATDAAASSGTRLAYGRPATDEDHAAAEAAERAQRTSGMTELARRCRTVWLVRTEGADDDPAALAIAAVLAGVFLGPILPPRGDALFGVKTARLRLEAAR